MSAKTIATEAPATPPIITPATPPIAVGGVGADPGAAVMAEASRQRMEAFKSGQSTFESVRKTHGAALWVLPPGFEGWAVTRLYPRNHPHMVQRQLADELEHKMRSFGWETAPRGTTHEDYAVDGDARRWLVAPPDVEKQWDEYQRAIHGFKKAATEKNPMERAAIDLEQRGVHVIYKPGTGQRSIR